jgi:AraC-like DNA-binding protein
MAAHLQGNGDPELALIETRQALARKFTAHTNSEGEHPTAISGLVLFRHTVPSACHPTMCEPSLSVFVQGRKLINLGGMEYMCDGSSFLVFSIDVPIQSQILEASEAAPLLAILLDTPEDIPFLAPLIQREITYRILKTPQGERLRAIATNGDLSNRTVKAIAWLRANYAKPLHMEQLAGIARMGVSTLHHQFRALTVTSPLQFQKQLRLQTARQRMLTDGIDATEAAYEVGYESVSQFSREYSRFFGQPPMRDIRTLRLMGIQQDKANN